MKRLLFLGLVTVGILCFSMSSVQAYPLDSYTLNFSAAADTLTGAAESDLNNVDEWQFFAHSIVAFHDNDTSGGRSVGDTFDNYIAIRATGFTDSSSQILHATDYGSGTGRNHEVTAIAKFSGIQSGLNSYSVTSIERFDVFFDAGDAFSSSDFSDLATFSNGTLVEQADLVLGAGVNTDPTGITGTLSMVLTLDDNLHNVTGANGEYWELDDLGLPFNMNLILGIVDSNVNPQDPLDESAFEDYFIIDIENDWDFSFATRNDGSFNKEVVPEPATMLLLGSGLLGLAGLGRKKKFFKKD